MEIKFLDATYRFDDSCKVSLPLKHAGTIDCVGWDIPLYWAIDSKGTTFGQFSGHGSTLFQCTPDTLLRAALEENDNRTVNLVRRLLGMKPAPAPWMKDALSQGWTPPENFNRDDYDWS
jgi:hypothetical protein